MSYGHRSELYMFRESLALMNMEYVMHVKAITVSVRPAANLVKNQTVKIILYTS